MEEFEGKKYERLIIPARNNAPAGGEKPMVKPTADTAGADDIFAEIEIKPVSGRVSNTAFPPPQKIKPPEKDELRELFREMREIAREYQSHSGLRAVSYENVRREDARIFYNQAVFMKDLTDNYAGNVPFSQYYPNYQQMSYEQLRTYFSWRTKVRDGSVMETSVSYAFLYIYELLNNIGTVNPAEGLQKLTDFWQSYRYHDRTLDKYVARWIKDYHIYYKLPHTLSEFIEKNNLNTHFKKNMEAMNTFGLYCAVGNYDITKSKFYNEGNAELYADCFDYVIAYLREVLNKHGIDIESLVFQVQNKKQIWKPFRDALFHQWKNTPDKRVIISDTEMYVCKNNNWLLCTDLKSKTNRQTAGYILKQIEAELRKLKQYKYKLTAKIETVEIRKELTGVGLSLDILIRNAVTEFYKDATKTVVTIDDAALIRIRYEASLTQEKLIVPETEETPLITLEQIDEEPHEAAETGDCWSDLKNALTETERGVLLALVEREATFEHIAGKSGIMPEVLADGINEKAADSIGDNLLDEEFNLYDDYLEQIKEILQ